MSTSTLLSMSSITNLAALPVFGASASALQLSEILDSSLDAKLGRELARTPADLTRVVYVPRHGDGDSHLPLYDVSPTYFAAVGDAPIGSNRYKLGLAMMRKPVGDGTDAEVRYLVDFRGPGSAGAAEARVERRLPGGDGEAVSVTFAPEGEDESFQVTPLNTGSTRALRLWASFPVPDTTSADQRERHPWFTVSHQARDDDDRHDPEQFERPGLEWQTRPVEHGPLRYTLVDAGGAVHAVYHHAGIAFGLPRDYSEGVLLLSEGLSGEAEALAVATLLGLLRQVRRINQPAPRPRKKSLVRRVLGKI